MTQARTPPASGRLQLPPGRWRVLKLTGLCNMTPEIIKKICGIYQQWQSAELVAECCGVSATDVRNVIHGISATRHFARCVVCGTPDPRVAHDAGSLCVVCRQMPIASANATTTAPGTRERIEVYRLRVKRRECLAHPQDMNTAVNDGGKRRRNSRRRAGFSRPLDMPVLDVRNWVWR